MSLPPPSGAEQHSIDRLTRSGPAPLAALFLLLSAGAAAQAQLQGTPPAVTVAVVESREVTPSAEFIGQVEAIRSFPYEADLISARAQLARAEAALRQAKQAYARARELREREAVSQATLDEATAARDTAEADVLAARAGVRAAELTLGYTRIESPIEGRIGATAVTEENLVGPNTGVLATVIQLDPIRVVFSVSDRDLISLRQQFEARSLDELAGRFVPLLELSNGTEYPHPGRIAFASNRVDPTTGTVAIRAVFENPTGLLLPGQYVSVIVRPDEPERAPVIPVGAVQRDRDGSFVLVLDDENRVRQRRIETGAQIEQVLVVESGLQEGETVVVGGMQKVQPGMTVQPVPQTAPG